MADGTVVGDRRPEGVEGNSGPCGQGGERGWRRQNDLAPPAGELDPERQDGQDIPMGADSDELNLHVDRRGACWPPAVAVPYRPGTRVIKSWNRPMFWSLLVGTTP